LGRERGHLGRGAAGETPALRWGGSAAILAAGQRARRPLSVGEGARPSWPRGSGRDARSPLGKERGHLGRGAAGETPALRWGRSAAILAAGQRARPPLSVGEGARPSWPRGSGRDARSPLGRERGHLGRGAAGGPCPMGDRLTLSARGGTLRVPRYGLGARADMQFLVNVAHVGVDRAERDAQLVRDLLRAMALGQ